jgi:sodium transport system permease protein
MPSPPHLRRYADGDTPSSRVTLLFLLGVAFLYLLGGLPLQLLFGEVGIGLMQVGLLLVPALLLVKVMGYDPVKTFSLRPPPRGSPLRGAILLMAGGVILAWFLAWAQSFVIPVPVEVLEALAAFLTTDDPLRFLWLLLLVAVIPAVAEEFLFRGVVLSGLRRRLGTSGAVVGSALAFGIFHLSPQTAFRFLPTFWLGILLAWVVVETRSIWVGVLLHFLNNGTILFISFLPATRELGSQVEQDPPLLLLPVGVALFVTGAILLRTARHARGGAGGDPGFSS